jgi:hypothetical protein
VVERPDHRAFDEERKVMVLKLGAHDYIVKPFANAELAARCEAAPRRDHKSEDKSPIVRTGPLVVDLVLRSVVFGEEPILLTKKGISAAPRAGLTSRPRGHASAIDQGDLGKDIERRFAISADAGPCPK